MLRSRSYAQMSEEEIKLDRYSKFRNLGRYEEYPVIGGQWQQARAEREQVRARGPKICKSCVVCLQPTVSDVYTWLAGVQIWHGASDKACKPRPGVLPNHVLGWHCTATVIGPAVPDITCRSRRAQAAGVRTKVGTWALSEAEAAMIELSADRDEKWEASLVGKEQWLHKPLQPPGLLRSGALLSIPSL